MWGDRARLVEGAVLFALLAAVALHAAAPITCTDFHWHLKLGELIDHTGNIPRVDTFSAVHPEAPYIQPQWLWEWLAAKVYQLGGFRGIRVVQAGMLIASFLILYGNAKRLTLRASAATLICVLGFAFFEDRFRARPDGMTLGFVALSLPLLLLTPERRTTRTTLLTFALSVLWANMHGGASVLLLLSMLALAAGAGIEARLHRGPFPRFQLQQVLVVCAGLLCSPTMIPGFLHWAALIGTQIDTGNEEWLPTYTVLRQAVTPVTVLVAAGPPVVALTYVWEQWYSTRRQGLRDGAVGEWLLSAGYLVLSYQAIRNSFLCIIPVLFMLARRGMRQTAGRDVALGVAAASIALITGYDVVERSYGGLAHAAEVYAYDHLPDVYPEQAADFLEGAGIEGGIFNEGKWGGYLIFRGYPRNHVFVDTRQNFTREMWDLFLGTLSVRTRAPAFDRAMQRWGVELTVFRAPTFALGTPAPGWRLLYRSGDQEVYQHLAGAHARQNLARAEGWLRAQAPSLTNLDPTELALRVGAERWLNQPAQRIALAQSKARSVSPLREERFLGYTGLAELHYRAGLCKPALEALSEAEKLAVLSPRHLYVDAMCSHFVADSVRVRRRLGQLQAQGVANLSARQRERLDLLLQATR